MIQATLTTHSSSDGGTFGELVALRDDKQQFFAHTAERPPTGDHPCIPGGEYNVIDCDHPEHGMCYEVEDVPGREAILIHSANVWQQLLGCIALGKTTSIFGPNTCHAGMPPVQTWGVTQSDDTMKAFMAFCNGQPIRLTIKR